VRYGRHLLMYQGANNDSGSVCAFAFSFQTEAEAQAALAAYRANQPKGYVESNPFYRKGKGQIFRTWTNRKESGKMTGVLDTAYRSLATTTDYPTEADAIAAYNRDELAWLKAGNEIGTIEWLKGQGSVPYLKKEDMTLKQFINGRYRSHYHDALWHVQALPVIYETLKRRNLLSRLPNFSVDLQKGATEKELAAFEKSLPIPIHPDLKKLWQQVGSARWTLGEEQFEFLSPSDVLKHREALRVANRPKAKTDDDKKLVEQLDTLVVKNGNTPTLIHLSHAKSDDGKAFAPVPDSGLELDNIWFQKSLGDQLALYFTLRLIASLEERLPELETMKYGDKENKNIIRRRLEFKDKTSSKFWEITYDDLNFFIATRYGKTDSDGASSRQDLATASEAQAAYEKAIKEKIKKGYKEVGAKGSATSVAVKSAPAKKVAAKKASMKKASMKTASMKTASMKTAPTKKAPAKKVAATKSVSKKTAAKKGKKK
jgi:predicted DNA-binding WGR domain protein